MSTRGISDHDFVMVGKPEVPAESKGSFLGRTVINITTVVAATGAGAVAIGSGGVLLLSAGALASAASCGGAAVSGSVVGAALGLGVTSAVVTPVAGGVAVASVAANMESDTVSEYGSNFYNKAIEYSKNGLGLSFGFLLGMGSRHHHHHHHGFHHHHCY